MGRGEEFAFSAKDIIQIALKMLGGVLTGRLRISTIQTLLKFLADSGRITALYGRCPETPDGYAAWKQEADVK